MGSTIKPLPFRIQPVVQPADIGHWTPMTCSATQRKRSFVVKVVENVIREPMFIRNFWMPVAYHVFLPNHTTTTTTNGKGTGKM